MTVERQPEPGLESVIAAARAGDGVPIAEVMQWFARWPVVLPSRSAESIEPVLFAAPDGSPRIAVFSALDLADEVMRVAPHVALVSGQFVLDGAQGGAGVMVNANSGVPGFEVDPEMAPKYAQFTRAETPDPPERGRPMSVAERAIIASKVGGSREAAVSALATGRLLMPSSTLTEGRLEQLSPIWTGAPESPRMALFTHEDLIRDPWRSDFPYIADMPAPGLLDGLAPDLALILNPGTSFSLQTTVEELRAAG